MKKLLLIAALAATCLCLLTAPAFSGPTAPTQRLPVNASIVWDFAGGWWDEYSGLTGTADDDVFWQAYARNEPYFKPVPIDRPVLDTALAWDITYGRVLNEPNLWLATIDVYGPAPKHGGGYGPLIQHVTPQAALQYWTGPYAWDEFWATIIHPCPAFNPKIEAGAYGNNLYVPLGPFPKAGWYHVDTSWQQASPYTDLGFFAGSTPQHYPSGSLDGVNSLDMYVQ